MGDDNPWERERVCAECMFALLKKYDRGEVKRELSSTFRDKVNTQFRRFGFVSLGKEKKGTVIKIRC